MYFFDAWSKKSRAFNLLHIIISIATLFFPTQAVGLRTSQHTSTPFQKATGFMLRVQLPLEALVGVMQDFALAVEKGGRRACIFANSAVTLLYLYL